MHSEPAATGRVTIAAQALPENEERLAAEVGEPAGLPSGATVAGCAFLGLAVQALVSCAPALADAVDGQLTDAEFVDSVLAFGAVVFVYLFVLPPLVYNYLRVRWYKRGTLETYFQFMFVFLCFPALLLWAPFINFRQFPNDPAKTKY